ncbi:MAG: ABC transporter ATP-binding protein, partial [Deltaproteobacteria bacterium]|nr:ABC transporter ATP-binding protein [Deltaproteobacteria bacterium]
LFGHLGAADREAVQEAIAACDLDVLASRRVGRLSGGERQRARLALALAQGAPLLLLDEPTTHLDLRRRQEIFELLKRLRSDRALIVVMVLHELAEAYTEADRVLVLSAAGAEEIAADDPTRRDRLAAAFEVSPERIILGGS